MSLKLVCVQPHQLPSEDVVDRLQHNKLYRHGLGQCFLNARPPSGTGPWHQLYRAARGSPGICRFSFLSIFHEQIFYSGNILRRIIFVNFFFIFVPCIFITRKFLSPTNAPFYYTYKILKYTVKISHDCSYMFRSTWTTIREPMTNLAEVTIFWR
jgi:hypothetical protein